MTEGIEEPTEIEIFTRYGQTVLEMNDAFVFVMEHMEKVGPNPSVEIMSCFNSEDGSFAHYHVAVYGHRDVPKEEHGYFQQTETGA